MKDLVAIATWVLARAFDTGDDLDEANFDNLFQAAANRSEYLKAQVDDLQSTGAKKIRVVASAAALKALTGMSSGHVAVVNATGARGLYIFILTGALPSSDVTKWLYKADDLTGYWLNINSEMMALGGADGLSPRLDPATIASPHRQVSEDSVFDGGTITIAADGTWQDVSGLVSNSIAYLSGDIVHVDLDTTLECNDANGASIRLAIQGDAALGASTKMVYIPAISGWKIGQHLYGRHTPGAPTSSVYLPQIQAANGSTVKLIASHLRCRVVRP